MAYEVIPNITCDGPGCTKRKEQTNHWILGFIDTDTDTPNIKFTAWMDGHARSADYHLCGEHCASKIFSQQLTEWSRRPNGNREA